MTTKKVALYLILLALSSLNAGAQSRSITLTGQVSEGKKFSKTIGQGLDFVLAPDSNDGSVTGWTLQVSPESKQADPECDDFAWVVTPPYHFQNVLYLDTSYGVTAQEAVSNSPRDFNFVLNCSDYKIESKRVELVLYSSNAPEKEVEDARAKLGSSPLGKGRLWIEDSKVTPGHDRGKGRQLGAIQWIRFKVEIEFPATAPQQVKP